MSDVYPVYRLRRVPFNFDDDWARLITHVGPCLHDPKAAREPYEALVRAIAYQQLTAKAGDAIIARLLALYPKQLFRRPSTSWSPELLARVATINGMGRWTVQMLLMYSLERMHILPADDFGVREGYRSLKSLPGTARAERVARDRESLGATSHPCRMVSWRMPREHSDASNDGLGREGPMQY